MIVFKRKQVCSRCEKEYGWQGYKLNKGELFVGSFMPSHFQGSFERDDGSYDVMLICDCGYHEEAKGNYAISKKYTRFL